MMERPQTADDKFASAQLAAVARALREHEKLMRQAQRETQGGGYQTENMFGKIQGRFDEAEAKDAVNEIIKRFAWGFASLSEPDKARAMVEFNTLLNPHHTTHKPKYEVVKHG